MRAGARALIIVVVVLGGLLALPPLAAAQTSPLAKPTGPEAREHLALGNKLYNVRSFDEAITEYKAGALVEPAPVFDYNLGQCYRLTGKYQDAIWHYERFLARGKPQGKLLDSVNDFIAQMKSELDKKAMTQKPTEPAPSSSSVASTPTVVPPQLAPSPLPRPRQTDHGTDAWYQDGVGWALTGAGVAGVVTSAVFFVRGSELTDEANTTLSQQHRHELRDSASTQNLLGTGIGIGGAVLLVSGIIKLAVNKPDLTAHLDVAASSTGVAIFGEF